ncbi:MAG: DUF3365 domain-containing protein, partial [Desulfobacteraceae bacterium]|nr:DUF3365 domain-containing protein [Desulfobacteraceae bacterium]
SGDLYYKQAAINARNPENEANTYEKSFIDELNKDPKISTRSGVRILDGKPYFVVLRPGEAMQEACLRCHSTPDKAPLGLVKHYGSDRAFHRKIGEIPSTISIRIPLSSAYAEANRFSVRLSAMLLITLGCIFGVLLWTSKRFIFVPLAKIQEKAYKISMDSDHLGEEIPLPYGRELSQLTAAFNAMSVGLRNNSVYLEKRATELSNTNEQLSREITDRKQAEDALRESEEKYRSLVESTQDSIYVVDRNGTYLFMNKRHLSRLGVSENSGKTYQELHSASDTQEFIRKVEEVFASNEPVQHEHKSRRDGRHFIRTLSPVIGEDGRTKAVTVVSTDITDRVRAEKEQKMLQDQLHRAQKMEAMGLMAGGIAHDLNNILSGIVSYPELLLMDIPVDSPMRKPMETIKESGMRAADVVSDLMTIARGVATSKEVLNFNTVVEEYLNSTEHKNLVSFRPSVTFKTQFDSDLLNVNGSPTHIKKILMNLVINASEAIEGSGTVTISTMSQYLDEPLRGYEDVVTGEYVMLTVSDDGSGISQIDLERIFEPFYTKKVMDRSGTGLGLAIVWNSVQDHNGYINVKSSKKGTVFELYFPVTREEVAAKEEEVPPDNYLGHGEKILVVDDEDRQREIASGILTRLGYNAETVSSGEEAIKYVKEHPVDLIVLDMVMPKGINGRETYEEIIKIRPGQKAIIASGYVKTKEVDIAQELGAGKYIKKPYTLSKVGIAVKEELEK